MLGRCALLAAAATLLGGNAIACDDLVAPISGFQVLPASGTRVPRSTAMWVRADQETGAVKDPSVLRLTDERGKAIALTSTSVRVAGALVGTLFVLRPKALLDANTTFRLENNGTSVTEFVTSEEVDTKPPEVLRATLSDVKAECRGSTVEVLLESSGDIHFLIPGAAQASATMPGAASAITTDQRITATAVPDGVADFQVLSFDVSGNMALSPTRITTLVQSQGGCQSVPGGVVGFFGLMPLVALLRRRASK